MNSILFNNQEDISIKVIQNYLKDYLEGDKDSKWQFFIPYFLKKSPPPVFKYKEKILNFADLYEIVLSRKQKDQPCVESEKTPCPYSDWLKEASKLPTTDCLRAVYDLKKYIDKNFTADELVGFYIYGGMANLNYFEGCSDLDTIFVLRKAVLRDINWLSDFRKRMLRGRTFSFLFNPFAVHGNMVISEYDLESPYENAEFIMFIDVYFSQIFELSTYSNKLKFRYLDLKNNYREIRERRIALLCKVLKNSIARLEKRKFFNSFELVFAIFIIRALFKKIYEWEKGLWCHSPEHAISILDESALISPKSRLLIKKVYEVREECIFHSWYPYNLRKWIGLNWDFRLLRPLHRYFDHSLSAKILQITGNSFAQDTLDFCTEVERQIKIDDSQQ